MLETFGSDIEDFAAILMVEKRGGKYISDRLYAGNIEKVYCKVYEFKAECTENGNDAEFHPLSMRQFGRRLSIDLLGENERIKNIRKNHKDLSSVGKILESQYNNALELKKMVASIPDYYHQIRKKLSRHVSLLEKRIINALGGFDKLELVREYSSPCIMTGSNIPGVEDPSPLRDYRTVSRDSSQVSSKTSSD